MSSLVIILAAIYAVVILHFWLGNLFTKSGKKRSFNNKISVIIAARNEETNLPNLLSRLAKMDYPQSEFEIIIANDRSIDNTGKILQNWQNKIPNLRVVTIQQEKPELVGKKNALQAAIVIAKYDILAFTDADCLPGKNWLLNLNSYFDDKTDYVAGYSPLLGKNNLLYQLKNLERASIFAVTAGSFFWNWGITTTGRNLAYRKELFEKVNGFDKIGHIRSGDDDLMLLKMRRFIRKMRFMFAPEAIVPAHDNTSRQAQINLESRRASKFRHYPADVKLLALVVFLFFIGFTVSFILFICGKLTFNLFLLLLCLKIVPEFLLISTFLLKIKNFKLIVWFPLAEILYIPYFLFFAIKGTWGKYRWKN